MVIGKRKRLMPITLVAVAVLIVGGVVGFRVAVGALKGRIEEGLGSSREVGDIRLGWFDVDIEGLRIKGPSGWPAADAMQAERVTVVPSLL